MKLVAWFCVLILAQLNFANAFEVVSANFQPPGQTNPRPCKFIKVDGHMILLPQRSSYRDVVHNHENSIWAVNYHETSNFDSVDLVISQDERLFVIPNIWSELEEKLKTNGLLPNIPLDRCHLTVTAVQADTLSCTFRGLSNQIEKEVTKSFSVSVRRQVDSVAFEIL